VTRWIAGAGAFLMSLDSMVNVAFPAMAASFHLPPEAMRSVIVYYVLTYAIVSFAGGAIGDRVGHAHVFRVGLAGCALAFVAAAAAPAFEWLLAGRVLQGFACGLVYGTAPGLTTLAVAPSARGRALGFFNAAMGLAGVSGPIAAGVLVDAMDWPSVFASRAPLALGVLAWASFSLRASAPAAGFRMVRPADLWRGVVIRACGLSMIANGAIFAIWLLAPFYLVDVRGLDAKATGLFFMLTPLGTALAAPVAGRIVDRAGARLPLVLGLAVECLGLLALSRARVDTPTLVVASALLASGIGLGLFQVPNMTSVMSAFPTGQQGAAGGLALTARTLGVVSGVTTLSSVFATRRTAAGFDAAFSMAFVVAAGAVGAAALAALVPERRVRPQVGSA
jgi:MFS family permease